MKFHNKTSRYTSMHVCLIFTYIFQVLRYYCPSSYGDISGGVKGGKGGGGGGGDDRTHLVSKISFSLFKKKKN